MKRSQEYCTWQAMKKFADGQRLTTREWADLSALTLIDKAGDFGPGNCRWAQTDQERADNLAFYKAVNQRPNKSIH